jgi:ankyrin repeat protein
LLGRCARQLHDRGGRRLDTNDPFLAIDAEDPAALTAALADGVAPDAARNEMGRTLLGQAACTGNPELARVLIKHGADVESCDSPGDWTVMTTAALFGNTAFLERLLEAGADPNSPATRNVLADSPMLEGMPAVVSLLCRHGASYLEPLRRHLFGGSPLFEAIEAADVDALERAVAAGANPNAANAAGYSALRLAASLGNPPVGAALLAAGADIESRPAPDASTPLMTAADAGHLAFVELLVNHGANVNATIEDSVLKSSYTALDLMNMNPKHWRAPVYDFLLAHGAECRAQHESPAAPDRTSPATTVRDASSRDDTNSAPRSQTQSARQRLETLVYWGVPVGFFFRQGLIMQADGSSYGLLIAGVASLIGAFLVFPVRPFWQPLVAVAAGMGIAELVNLIGG